MYAQLGHDGEPTNYWRENLLTGEPLKRCPVRELLDARARRPEQHAELQRYIATYHPAYRDGHLLVAGGIADQPARYLAYVQMVAALAEQSDAKYLELMKEEKP